MYVLNNRLIGFAIAALAGASLCGLFAPVAVHGQDMPSYGDVQDGAIEIGQLLYQGGPQRSRGEALGAAFRIGHFTGPALGRDQSITPIEFMPYAFQEDWLFFGDLRGFRSNNDRYGANMGAGVRRYVRSIDRIFGVNFYHDYDETSGNIFRDMGFGIETYGQLWDARANAYFPLGKDTQEIRAPFVAPGSTRFSGNSLLFDQIRTVGVAPLGVDMEIGVPVPGRWTEKFDVRAYAGWYHYQARNLAETLWGYKGRVQGNIFPSLAMSLELTHDQIFDTTLSFGVQYTFGGHKRADDDRPSTFDRMTTPVRRNYNVVVAQNSVRDAGLTAINPDTGNAYFIEHVSNAPNRTSTSFDGTFENPWLNLGESAQTTGREDVDIVFVHANSQYVGGSTIVLNQPNLRILGEGDVAGTGSVNLGTTANPDFRVLGDGTTGGRSIDHSIRIRGFPSDTVLPRATFTRTDPNNPNSAFAFRDRPAFLDIAGNGIEAQVNNTEFSGFRLGQKLDFTNRTTSTDIEDRLRGGESNRLVDTTTGQSNARGPSGNGIVASNLSVPATGAAGSLRLMFLDINGAGRDGVLLENNGRGVAINLNNSRIHHSGGRGMSVDGGRATVQFIDTISTFDTTTGARSTFNDELNDRFAAGLFGSSERILEVQNTLAGSSVSFSSNSTSKQHATLLNSGVTQTFDAANVPITGNLNPQGISATSNAGSISLGIVLLGPIDTQNYGSFTDGLDPQITELNRQVNGQLGTTPGLADNRVIYDPTAVINISQNQGIFSFNAPVYVVNPVNQTGVAGAAVRIDRGTTGSSVRSDAPIATASTDVFGTTITVKNRGGVSQTTSPRIDRSATTGIEITNNQGTVRLDGGVRIHQQSIAGNPIEDAQPAFDFQNNGVANTSLTFGIGKTLLVNSDTVAMSLGTAPIDTTDVALDTNNNQFLTLSFNDTVNVEGRFLEDGIVITSDDADYIFRENVGVAESAALSIRGTNARGIAIENMRGRTGPSSTQGNVIFRRNATVNNPGFTSRAPAIDIRDTRAGRTAFATANNPVFLGQRATLNFAGTVNITQATRSLNDLNEENSNRIHEAAGFNVWNSDLLVSGLQNGARLPENAIAPDSQGANGVSQGAAAVTVNTLNVGTANGIGLAVREGNIVVRGGAINSTFGGPQTVGGGRSAVDIRDSTMNVTLTSVSSAQAGVGNSNVDLTLPLITDPNLANYAENGITLINTVPFGTFNQPSTATATRVSPRTSRFRVTGDDIKGAANRGTGGTIQAATGSGVFARNIQLLELSNMNLTGNGTAEDFGDFGTGVRGLYPNAIGRQVGLLTNPPRRRLTTGVNYLDSDGFYSNSASRQFAADVAEDNVNPSDFGADGITVVQDRNTAVLSAETIPNRVLTNTDKPRVVVENNIVSGSQNYGLYTYNTPEVSVIQSTFTSVAGETPDFAQIRFVNPFADNYNFNFQRNTVSELTANAVEIDNNDEGNDTIFRSLVLNFQDNGLITALNSSDGLFVDWRGGFDTNNTGLPANLDPASIQIAIDLNEVDLGTGESSYAFNVLTRPTRLPVSVSATRNARITVDQLTAASIRDDNRVPLPVDNLGNTVTQAGIVGNGANQRAFNFVTQGSAADVTQINIEGNHLGFFVNDPGDVTSRPGKIDVNFTGDTLVRIVRNRIELPSPTATLGTTAVRLSAQSGNSTAIFANNLITIPTAVVSAAPPVALRIQFARGNLLLTSADNTEPANNALRIGLGANTVFANEQQIVPLSLGGTVVTGSQVIFNSIARP